MQNKQHIFLAFLLFLSAFAKAQTDTEATIISQDSLIVTAEEYLPLRPAKAAFYSAILPGLGQAYNKDYWKIPIVYGALGTGVFFAVDNHNEFQRYRTAFKERLAGRLDEFSIIDPLTGEVTEIFTDDALIDAQDFFRRRKELSILISAGLYVLQVIEANVDAHLSQYDVDDKLTFAPNLELDTFGMSVSYGIKLTYHID